MTTLSRRAFTSGVSAFALISVAAPLGAVMAQAQPDAAAFVSDFTRKGITDILSAPIANTDKQQRFREMFKTYFDLPGIGRFVLTRYWAAATPAEQELSMVKSAETPPKQVP